MANSEEAGTALRVTGVASRKSKPWLASASLCVCGVTITNRDPAGGRPKKSEAANRAG
jgi:hypothetical protein